MIYWELFWSFLKVGAFTFGGGYAMLPLIQTQVAAHGWLTQAELVNFIAVSESTPGPFAVNISTFVGAKTAGILGALCATLGVVLPSFLIILIVAKCYEAFRKSKVVSGCMAGLKPAVVGLIAATLLSVGQTVFFAGGVTVDVFQTLSFYVALGIFALMTFLAFRKVSPVAIIGLSAVLGIGAGYALGL